MATAAHLADAAIAREWELQRLSQAHQAHLLHFDGDQAAANGTVFAGLGFAPPFPTTWAEAADRVVTDEARCLAQAQLYVMTPAMCDVVVAAALSLTTRDLQLAREEDLPSPTGLVVLPAPLLVRTTSGAVTDDRAYHWHTPATIPSPRGGRPACRFSVYEDTHGPVQPDTFRAFADEALRAGTPLPPLTLNHLRHMPFGFTDDPDDARGLRQAAQQINQTLGEQADALGLDETRVFGDYVPDDAIDDADDTFAMRFLYAFSRLCEQRIADVVPVETFATDQRAAERAGVSPDLRVVQLRRPETDPSHPSSPRNWQHRWVVRMHKVRQWYPSEQRHKVIYRGPYLKGPADKPLLGGEVVRGLTR